MEEAPEIPISDGAVTRFLKKSLKFLSEMLKLILSDYYSWGRHSYKMLILLFSYDQKFQNSYGGVTGRF